MISIIHCYQLLLLTGQCNNRTRTHEVGNVSKNGRLSNRILRHCCHIGIHKNWGIGLGNTTSQITDQPEARWCLYEVKLISKLNKGVLEKYESCWF